ncbi:MAG: DUF2202 domain-containing protein [Desulfobacterales bacterium]
MKNIFGWNLKKSQAAGCCKTYQRLHIGDDNLTSALEVGVKIEEMDIADIERMLDETDKADIERVLSNLLDGSKNHLDAFNTQLGLIPQ